MKRQTPSAAGLAATLLAGVAPPPWTGGGRRIRRRPLRAPEVKTIAALPDGTQHAAVLAALLEAPRPVRAGEVAMREGCPADGPTCGCRLDELVAMGYAEETLVPAGCQLGRYYAPTAAARACAAKPADAPAPTEDTDGQQDRDQAQEE